MILWCYALAERYHQDPAVFKTKPLLALLADLHWSNVLTDKRAEARRMDP